MYEKAGAQIITLALRRANEGRLANILDYILDDVTFLPQYIRSQKCRRSCTYCKTFQEKLDVGDFVKIEVVGIQMFLPG